MKYALIYVYRNESLGVILILCTFCRMRVLYSPLGPMTCLDRDSIYNYILGYGS